MVTRMGSFLVMQNEQTSSRNYDLSLNELEEMVRLAGIYHDFEYGEYTDDSRINAAEIALSSFKEVAYFLYAKYQHQRDVKIPFSDFKPFLDGARLCMHYGEEPIRPSDLRPLGPPRAESELPPL